MVALRLRAIPVRMRGIAARDKGNAYVRIVASNKQRDDRPMRTICIALVLALPACSDDRLESADKIAAARGGKVTVGGGKFINVELNAADQAKCDADQRWVRDNIKQPPDCVRVRCTLPSGEDSIVSYDGYWNGLQGGGYFPKCAK